MKVEVGQESKGVEPPNHTQVPNAFFDLLPEMDAAELKVMLFAIRQTFGWHKSCDYISISQFINATGLSRQGVLNGINNAKERGILKEHDKRGPRGIKLYGVIVKEVDQSTQLTSLLSRPVTSQQGRPDEAATSQVSRPTKEIKTKEKGNKEKESAPEGAAKPAPIIFEVQQALIQVFDYNEADMGKSEKSMLFGVAKDLTDRDNPVTPVEVPDLFAYVKKVSQSEGWTLTPNSLKTRVAKWRKTQRPADTGTPPDMQEPSPAPEDNDPYNPEHYPQEIQDAINGWLTKMSERKAG